MSLSPQWLDELRARTSLSGVIGRTTRLTKAGREFKACCPFHNEKSPSFTVNDDKGFYHCFGCGAHGDAIRWMTDQRGLMFMDAVKELAGEAGLELPAMDPRAAEIAEKRQGLDEVMVAAQAWFVERLRSDEGAAARKYLAGRGFAAAVVERFGFGFAPEGRQAMKAALKAFPEEMLIEGGLRIVVEEKEPYDRFRGRLMLPIRNPRGGIIGFGGRILDAAKTDAPKYLNSPDTSIFDKGRTLYNLDKAAPLARKSGRLVVVEGYMDVVALANAGIEEAVAPLGTALTEAQLELAWRVCETPVLCFDGDAAGQRAAMRAMIRALPLLSPKQRLKISRLPSKLDPDDLIKLHGVEAMLDVIEKAEPLAEALWQAELSARPLSTPEDKAALRNRLIEHVEKISDREVARFYRRELLDRYYAYFFPEKPFYGRRRDNLKRQIQKMDAEYRRCLLGFINGGSRDNLGCAVLAGLWRFPDQIILHSDSLARFKPTDTELAYAFDVLLDASDGLDPRNPEAIWSSIGPPPPKQFVYANFRFPFLQKVSDGNAARHDLGLAVSVLLERPEVEAALAKVERLFKDDPEGAFAEQQRLRETKLALEARLMQRATARAGAENGTNEPHGDH